MGYFRGALTWARAHLIDLRVATLLFCGVTLWHLPGLTLTPAVNHDEVMLTAAARSWTARGIVALDPLAERGQTYATAYYWHPPGHLVVMAAAYRLFGFSIATTRGVSLVSGAFCLPLLYFLLRTIRVSRVSAVVGALLLAAHPLFWWLCRSGRMDLIAIDLCLVAALTCARGADTSVRRAALAGALVGVAGLFHVIALFWAPALVVAGWARSRRVQVAPTCALLALAALPVFAWCVTAFAIGDGAAFREQFIGYAVGQRSGAGPLWRRPLDEVLLLLRQFKFQLGCLPVLLVGTWSGWKQRNDLRRWASGGAIAGAVLVTFGTSKGTGAYPLHWFVWLVLVAAAGLTAVSPRWRTWLIGVALLNAAAVQLALTGIGLYQREVRDPARATAFFRTHVRPGSIVLGPEDVWYAVEHAGAHLRIWSDPDPRRHDYVITFANTPKQAPAGFHLLAEQPDIMPKVAGRYFSSTCCSYRIWAADPPRP